MRPPSISDLSGQVLEIHRLEKALAEARAKFDRSTRLYAKATPQDEATSAEDQKPDLVDRPPPRLARKPEKTKNKGLSAEFLQLLEAHPEGLTPREAMEKRHFTASGLRYVTDKLETLGRIKGTPEGKSVRFSLTEPKAKKKPKPKPENSPRDSFVWDEDAGRVLEQLKAAGSEGLRLADQKIKAEGSVRTLLKRLEGFGLARSAPEGQSFRWFSTPAGILETHEKRSVEAEIREIVEAGFTNGEIAERCGVKGSTVSHWNSGMVPLKRAHVKGVCEMLSEVRSGVLKPREKDSLPQRSALKRCPCGFQCRGPSIGIHLKHCEKGRDLKASDLKVVA